MGTKRRADSYTITYDWKLELFRKIILAANISLMNEKFTFGGPKPIIIFSIFSRTSLINLTV